MRHQKRLHLHLRGRVGDKLLPQRTHHLLYAATEQAKQINEAMPAAKDGAEAARLLSEAMKNGGGIQNLLPPPA